MKLIRWIYCYTVIAILFVVVCAFHYFFACLFLFINPDAFHSVISKFENDIFKIIDEKLKE